MLILVTPHGKSLPTEQVTHDEPSVEGYLPADAWMELRDRDANAAGALVPLNRRDSQKFRALLGLETLDPRYRFRRARLNSAIVDQLASAAPAIHTALSAGQVYQVVGPPHLVHGVSSHTHRILRSEGALLGTIARTDSGKVAGQLRFMPKSTTTVVAPLLAYQILHAIAGTTQLRQISEKLDALDRGLHNLQARHDAEAIGLQWAIAALDDLLEEDVTTGEFSMEMILRLSHIEMTIGSLLQRNRILVETFRSKAKAATSRSGAQGAKRASALVLEDGPQAQLDMQILVGLAAADLRVQHARIRCAMEHSPADVARRMERAATKADSYREHLKRLPSIEAVAKHAQSCVDQMGWFRRYISARSTVREVRAATRSRLRDVRIDVTPFDEILRVSGSFGNLNIWWVRLLMANTAHPSPRRARG